MGGELVIKSGDLIPFKAEEVLSPLVKEIFLFNSYVAGTSYLKEKDVLKEIFEGQKLVLQRENNKFDKNAILVLTEDKRKVGYVPEDDNVVFSRLMDAGKCLYARVKELSEHKGFYKISIDIYLIDF